MNPLRYILLLGTVLTGILAAPRPAQAQFELRELVIHEQLPESAGPALVELWALDDAQRMIAEACFLVYRKQWDDINAKTHRAMLDAGHDELQALMAELDPLRYARMIEPRMRPDRRAELERLTQERKSDPRWEEANRIRSDILESQHAGRLEAWAALHDLFDALGLEARLSEDSIDAGWRLVFRQMFEPPGDDPTAMDFDAAVDGLRLIDDALAEDAELDLLIRAEPERPRLPSHEEAIAGIRLEYELRLHMQLERHIPRGARRRSRNAKYVIESTDPEFAKIENQFLRAWQRRHSITANAVKQVTAILQEGPSPDGESAWLRRYHVALAPQLFAERWPERQMLEWMEARADATPEQLELAAALKDEYVARLGPILLRAVDQGIAVRRKQIFAHGDTREMRRYTRSVLNIHRLSRSVIGRLHAALTPEQQAELEAVFAGGPRLSWGAMLLLGPVPDKDSAVALGLGDLRTEPVFPE